MAKVVSNKKQLSRLVELMEQNLDVAKGFCSKPTAQTKWDYFAAELNILGPPTRESHKWQRVWIDLKCKTKKKNTENKIKISSTGGGPNRLHNFNNLEKAVIKMLEMGTCVNPPGIEFGSEDVILNEVSTVSNTIEPNLENSIVKSEDFGPKNPRKTSRMEKLQTERKTLLETQTSAQNEFYENMNNLMGDIRRSIKNIKHYIQKDVRQKDEILKIKREKFKIYKENKQNKDRDRKAKLKLKMEILETRKKNF